MPSIRHRQRVIARNFISSSGLYKDLVIPYGDVFWAASSISSMSASLAIVAPTASGPAYLRFSGTSSGCEVTVQFPVPQDLAIGATTPAAGSGLIILDWLNASGNGKVVVVSACLKAVPSGSEWAAAGACNLATSTCTSLTGGSANAINSTSIVQFTQPTTRAANFVLRFAVRGQDAGNTSGSDFHLQNIRLRYLADRIGS